MKQAEDMKWDACRAIDPLHRLALVNSMMTLEEMIWTTLISVTLTRCAWTTRGRWNHRHNGRHKVKHSARACQQRRQCRTFGIDFIRCTPRRRGFLFACPCAGDFLLLSSFRAPPSGGL